MRKLIYRWILKPLILRNYRLREKGLKPDKWYWADKLAMSWGYLTEPNLTKLKNELIDRNKLSV